MQSAGNDIISLGMVNIPRSNNSRFYTKILSASEQLLYHAPECKKMPFENFVWLLWSVKESAYKYLKRSIPDLVFSPTKIMILHINIPVEPEATAFEDNEWQGGASGKACHTGTFIFASTIFYFRSKIHPELIATVVSEDENFEHTWWGIQTIEQADAACQSKLVRLFLLKKLNEIMPGMELRIETTAWGYPVILHGTKELTLPVSLAHHGHFIAYSFMSGST